MCRGSRDTLQAVSMAFHKNRSEYTLGQLDYASLKEERKEGLMAFVKAALCSRSAVFSSQLTSLCNDVKQGFVHR